MVRIDRLLLTCEHGGSFMPPRYARLFRGQAKLLRSHRGYDPGALELARMIARTYRAPLVSSKTSRLLVELNRSIGHPDLFSDISKKLDREERKRVLDAYYFPYRRRVEQMIERLTRRGHRVMHLSVHTFTPVLRGVIRNADIGLLFDPSRNFEARICRYWVTLLRKLAADLRIRKNYPYRGTADGLTTAMRRQFSGRLYAGIEIEVNQRFPMSNRTEWSRVSKLVVDSVGIIYRPPSDERHKIATA